jgi:glycosyltransferase involved in cell wall biosynthesis
MNSPAPESISVVVPVHNEEGSVVGLVREIEQVAADFPVNISEIVFVDDGSTDTTFQRIEEASQICHKPIVKCIRFRSRLGKSAALHAGFRYAEGDLVATIDGDLQDDPAEIRLLYEKLQKGYDLVSGWKTNRQDPFEKRVASKLFNATLRKFCGAPLHDFNCGLKLYRRSALQGLKVYGDMHRFLPVFLAERGFAVTEVPVHHRARQSGRSKYGKKRLFTGLLDFFAVIAVTKFAQRPGHLFGGIGLLLSSVGVLILSYLTCLWCLDLGPIGTRPLFFLGILCVLLGTQFVFFGVLAEVITRRLFRWRLSDDISESINLPAAEGK